MNTQYRMDKTPVATKNLASLDTSIDIPDCFRGSVVLLQINSPEKKIVVFEKVHFLPNFSLYLPNRNGYSILYGLGAPTVGLTVTFTSKFTVVYSAHIANI